MQRIASISGADKASREENLDLLRRKWEEINTIGSKSNHAGMQKIVVLMKDELED
ncbi:MAG: hypothetical protein R2850_09700 [Bacteroidia bacterium]